MARRRARKRRGRRRPDVLQKPRGIIHPRVQKIGPEHFGIVSVDCAKRRSKWMLCDFYGNLLLPPAIVENLGLTGHHAEVILSAGVGEGILIVESKPYHVHFQASRTEVEMLTPYGPRPVAGAVDLS